MKKAILILLVVLSVNPAFAVSEDDYFRVMGEIYFRFQKPAMVASINEISRIVSIEKITSGWIYAYANEDEFRRFVSLNLHYEILEHPNFKAAFDTAIKFSLQITHPEYPSYPEYILIMNQFHSQYPEICQIYEIGTSVFGRKILCAKITGQTDYFFKPRIFFFFLIHGNFHNSR